MLKVCQTVAQHSHSFFQTMTEKIKIALVDDELLFRKGMELIINQDPELEVVFHAVNGKEFLNAFHNNTLTGVNIVLLDLSMPVMDGIDTLLAIAPFNNKPKIIILTSHYTESVIVKLLDEGASSFLAKNENPDIVLETIKNVAKRGFHYDDFVMQLLRNQMKFSKKNKTSTIELSEREVEVLRLICQEFTAKEIAEQLYLSTRTVEGHRNNMLEKIGAKNTIGLVIYAIEHRLFDVKIPI